jgi:hypothetical protein
MGDNYRKFNLERAQRQEPICLISHPNHPVAYNGIDSAGLVCILNHGRFAIVDQQSLGMLWVHILGHTLIFPGDRLWQGIDGQSFTAEPDGARNDATQQLIAWWLIAAEDYTVIPPKTLYVPVRRSAGYPTLEEAHAALADLGADGLVVTVPEAA